ncbi:hypothetical protein AALA80_11050 [Oscillospiraceae bacterium 50-60]
MIVSYIRLFVLIGFVIAVFVIRGRYKNRSGAGAFFFENDCLVLNTGLPYPIPFDQIERVELNYSSWELEHRMSYNLSVRVVRKDGGKKRVFYKGYKTAKLALPSDMEAALRERGIPCVMTDDSAP